MGKRNKDAAEVLAEIASDPELQANVAGFRERATGRPEFFHVAPPSAARGVDDWQDLLQSWDRDTEQLKRAFPGIQIAQTVSELPLMQHSIRLELQRMQAQAEQQNAQVIEPKLQRLMSLEGLRDQGKREAPELVSKLFPELRRGDYAIGREIRRPRRSLFQRLRARLRGRS